MFKAHFCKIRKHERLRELYDKEMFLQIAKQDSKFEKCTFEKRLLQNIYRMVTVKS